MRCAGFAPSARRCARATRGSARAADQFAPVLGVDLRREPAIVLDLSVASPLLQRRPARERRAGAHAASSSAMREAGVRVAIGRYDEPRLLYVAPAFALGAGPRDEHRTIHIGLDLFAPAGTPVYAPLDGVVHAFARQRGSRWTTVR